MITSLEQRDLEEMIPGNIIDRIWGSDKEESVLIEQDDIQDCAEQIRCIPVRPDHPGVLIKTGHPRMGCLDGDA